MLLVLVLPRLVLFAFVAFFFAHMVAVGIVSRTVGLHSAEAVLSMLLLLALRTSHLIVALSRPSLLEWECAALLERGNGFHLRHRNDRGRARTSNPTITAASRLPSLHLFLAVVHVALLRSPLTPPDFAMTAQCAFYFDEMPLESAVRTELA